VERAAAIWRSFKAEKEELKNKNLAYPSQQNDDIVAKELTSTSTFVCKSPAETSILSSSQVEEVWKRWFITSHDAVSLFIMPTARLNETQDDRASCTVWRQNPHPAQGWGAGCAYV